MNCPFRNFEECPEHNKKGGCAFWLAYGTNREGVEAQIEGCAVTLTPMLLLENANNLGIVAGEVNKVGAEISAGRSEAVKNGEATRMQLVSLANGRLERVIPDYSTTMKIEAGPSAK